MPSTAQRRRWFEIVISGLIIPTYLRLYFSDIARGQACLHVCMFQDSVPAGSYNDPFLSSVSEVSEVNEEEDGRGGGGGYRTKNYRTG